MSARAPLVFVLALARHGVLGRDGKLPWDYPEDRAHFHRLTVGHAVIMGHRTWDETGEPLAGRRNVVVSRDRTLVLPGAEVVDSVERAITLARATDPEPRVIGGAAIFVAALPWATRIELTEIDREVEGDTRFDFPRGEWKEVSRREGVDTTLSFVTLVRAGG